MPFAMRTDTNSTDASHRSRSNRVPRACDRCRIRKIKCNGKNQCSRCGLDDAICVYTKRRRPNDRAYSKEYVQLLEEQQNMLIRGMKELYRRSRAGEALPDLPSSDNDQMLIHEVLASLNVLNDERDMTDTDYDSVAGDFPTTGSTRGSICSDSPMFTEPTQMPILATSPSSLSPPSTSPQSRDQTQSPQMPPTMADYEKFQVKFNSSQMHGLPTPLDPTPKAIEYTFSEAFQDVYLFGGDQYFKGGMETFVNPCDTTFNSPYSNPYSV